MKKDHGFLRGVVSLFAGALLAVIVIGVLYYGVGIRAIAIVGDSMSPTLQDGKILILQGNKELEAKQLVLFESPPSWGLEEAPDNIIKRVVAMPGDMVSYNEHTVLINETEEYSVSSSCTMAPETKTIPEGFIMVRGDNQEVSFDSLTMWCEGYFDQGLVPVDYIENNGTEWVKIPS